MAAPRPTNESHPSPHWAGADVIESLHCRRCGYNLRGLRAEGRCPECGMDIWSTVLATIDPAATRLPSLRNPRAVGDALLALTIAMLAGALLMAADSVLVAIETWTASPNRDILASLPLLNWIMTPVIAAAGLWAMWALLPPRGREPYGPVWIDLWRIAVGFIGWRVVALFWLGVPEDRFVLVLASAVFATIGLLGLRGVFGVIGQRSREYRRSKGGRQSLELMIAAIVAHAAAALIDFLTRFSWFPGQWRGDVRTITTTVMWISALMVLIGLAYLVMNAIWIRRALRRPPPRIEEVLRKVAAPAKWIADRE